MKLSFAFKHLNVQCCGICEFQEQLLLANKKNNNLVVCLRFALRTLQARLFYVY